MNIPLLEVRDLSVDYRGSHRLRAVDRVTLSLFEGEFLAVVGESGSGKSTLASAILRLLAPPAVITGGEVIYDEVDLLDAPMEELRAVRWREIAMVFQSAMNALNPVITIGEQLLDVLFAHERLDPVEARERAVASLEDVELTASEMSAYPHQLSGGMRQRVAIAMALVLEPRVLVLDEPTTALDVIVQRSILERLAFLRDERQMSALVISHDLAAMLEVCDRIAVLYAGRVVETISAARLRREGGRHPYTRGLLEAYPSLHGPRRFIEGIPGQPPDLADPPSGCRFHPRCPFSERRCHREQPKLVPLAPKHRAACHCL